VAHAVAAAGERTWRKVSMSTVCIQAPFGALPGVDQGDVHVFRGIRFVEPPVGALRFQPPEPTGPWSATI